MLSFTSFFYRKHTLYISLCKLDVFQDEYNERRGINPRRNNHNKYTTII